jgi:hypothetical protein
MRTLLPRLSVAVVLLLALLACKKKNNQENQAPPPPTQQPVVTTPQPTWFSHRASGTQLIAPVGWSQKHGDSWVAFTAPDKSAVLALDSYAKGKDPSATIMKVARALGLVDIDWKGGTKSLTINGIPGKTADGTCKVGGQSAIYSYATLTTGASANILVLYAVEDRAPAQRRQEASQSLRSIRRM